ncbi:DUF6078 family protein [Bacteroides sp.]
MKEEHDFSQVPCNYTLCLNSQCPKASTCLRQLIEQETTDSIKYLVIINPKHLSTLTGECPYYRCSTKVLYAKGLIGMLDSLPRKQMDRVVSLIIRRFSQRTYYRIRKGERLLSPSEQQEIITIFQKCGVDGIQQFDAYIEDYEW